jgi:RNA recognition motif-containing protein
MAEVSTRKDLGTTVFIGNLNRNTPQSALTKIFKECGEISEVRLAKNSAGERRPFAHIEFATSAAAEAALAKNGTEIQGDAIKVEKPREDEYSAKTVYVCKLPATVGANTLIAHFKTSGNIKEVRIANGYAHVEYKHEAGAKAALSLNGSTLDNAVITVEKAVVGRKRKRYGRRTKR